MSISNDDTSEQQAKSTQHVSDQVEFGKNVQFKQS